MFNTENFDYELIDSGSGRRIERFGSVVIDRPCPGALWRRSDRELIADVAFYRDKDGGRWNGIADLPQSWEIGVGDNKAQLRFSPNGQVGVFPEQLENWSFIEREVERWKDRAVEGESKIKILNTFAYTGMSTLVASHPHTEVCHVDGAKSSISWGKENAALSGKSDNTIRWICDDVVGFMEREVRRGNKYDAIILDPPAFGRGAKKTWKIEKDIYHLMDLVAQLLTEKPLFVILTCHAPDHFSAKDFAVLLQRLPGFTECIPEELDLEIPSEQGNSLPSSFGARISQ